MTKLAKEGQTIEWTLTRCGKLNGTYRAKVLSVDFECESYHVHCEYGNDMVPFLMAKVV